ncbi:Flagellar hook-basal body complex protein FliE [Candidatus Cyrtobacter comes]|uniref:Flagellar hook-basal body complex protein FliE n=1 Tax=Candidatus Cyrtobacter comes TaxID=675776 RepID=A0ABU5L9B2_9RICK|nr:Flagellar hook-basal body complex protein FliE [Candidatus Cyrtobacter comes]
MPNQQGVKGFAELMKTSIQNPITSNSTVVSSAALENVGMLRKWAKEKINKVKEADFAIKKAVSDRDFASGSVKVLAAINTSEEALTEFMLVKNKLVSAYQAIMNMNI